MIFNSIEFLIFGIVFGVTWLLTAIIFRYSSLSSMVGSMTVFIYSIFLGDEIQSYFLFIIFVVILFAHKTNIIRLKNSKENKIKLKS